MAVELLDIDSEEEKTINHLLIGKFHPITSLSPKLPSVSICYMHVHVVYCICM